MLKDLSEGDLVMCVRADRLCRSLHSLIEVFDALESKGATGHMMDCGIRTDTPTGRVMLQMMTLVAEVESREISRSTKAGLMVRIAKKGIWATGVPAAFRHHEYKPDKKNPWIAIFSENEQIAIWTKLLRLVRKEGLTPAEAVKAVSRELAERYNLPVPRKRRYVIAGTEVSGKRVWQAIPELDALDEKYGWSLERHRLRQEFERSDPGREYTGFPCLAKHASRQYEVMSRWLDAINLEEITTDVVDRAEAAILRRLKSFAEQMGK